MTELDFSDTTWRCGGFSFDLDKPLIMGIVNVTPDSFSDGGDYFSCDVAYEHALQLVAQGAAIIDVGGESTRPSSDEVSAADELARVLPVVTRLAAEGVVVSVDTRHAEVASACVAAGAAIINDVSGFRDPEMVAVAANCDAGLIVMHMLGEPKNMQADPIYVDVVREVGEYLCSQAAMLEAAGVAGERIAIDPGPGFGKNYEHNLALLRGNNELASLGYPLVAAFSRKSFVGQLAGITDVKKRDGASVAIACYAADAGARILRVHDVAGTREALAVLEVTGAFDQAWHRAIVALGSNLGDSTATIEAAIQELNSNPKVSVVKTSSIYLSEPAYNEEQEPFSNAVIEIKTKLNPYELLSVLQAIEDSFGRTRSEKANAPRTLDLDIIDYEGKVSDDPVLLLPHPVATERDFVVTPLLEIIPDYTLADGTKVSKETVTVGKVCHFRNLPCHSREGGNPHPQDTDDPTPGKLQICATPIGNLSDITPRVVEALKTADIILAEDTRVARKLLTHLNIHANKLQRCDENVIRQATPNIIQKIQAGSQVALISDAGTPGIADPGSFLIDAAIKTGCQVEVLPGASAAICAVVASGLSSTDHTNTPAFYFGGFLPRKKAQITATLNNLADLNALLVFFESPHRTAATLEAIAETFPDRQVALTRELTKLHEEVIRGSAKEITAELEQRAQKGQQLKGEIALVIAPNPQKREKRVHQDRYANKNCSS